MNSLKRLLSLLLVMVMLLNTMPMSALATDVPGDESTSQQEPAAQEPSEDQPEETPNPEETPEQPAVDTQEGEDEGTVNPPVNEESPAPEDDSAPPVDGDNNPPAEPTPVEKVQAMIDALVIPNEDDYDSAASYEAALAQLEAELDAIDEAVVDFTEEQAAQVDITKYEEAWETIYGYYVAKMPATLADVTVSDGTEAKPHIIVTDTGSIAGSDLYGILKDTLNLNESYNLMGYFLNGKQVTAVSQDVFSGKIPVYDVKRTGTWVLNYKYSQGDTILAWIDIPQPENAEVKLKDGITSSTVVDVPTNFYYSLNAAEQNFVAKVVEAAAVTGEGYDPAKMALQGKLGVVWTDYSSAMGYKTDGQTENARLVYNDQPLGEFVIKFVESRPTVAIENVVGPTDTFTYVDKPEDAGAADVKAKSDFTLSDASVSKDAVTFSAADYHFGDGWRGTEIEEGATAAITFTLKLADTADYIGSTAEVTVNIRNITDANGNGTHDGEETQYTINWVNGDETVKSVTTVGSDAKEVAVAYDGKEPTKASDGSYNYYFAGWDTNGDGEADVALADAIKVETADITATAIYTAKAIVAVVFVDGVGNTLLSEKVEVGSATPAAPTATRQYYTFKEWSPAVAETVTEAVTYTAQWTADLDVNDNNIADQEEFFTITWVVEGQENKTTSVKWGSMPDYNPDGEDDNPPAPDDKTFAGWNPTLAVVEKDTTYVAKFTDDVVWEVKFMVDGEVYGDIQYVNVDKNETVVTPDAPTKTNFKFAGWNEEIVATPTANAVYTAQWKADANNNDVFDDEETVTLTAAVTGNGTVAPVANDNIVITENANGSWTVLYNSKVQGANVIAITATPKDTKADDGSVDYLISSDETIDLTTDTVINAEFGTESITVPESGRIFRNGVLTEAYDKLKGLKADILAAAGIADNAANYTVYMVTRAGTYNVESDNFLYQSAMAAAMTVGESQTFKIEKTSNPKAPVSDTISILVAESRATLTVTAAQETIEFSGKTEAEGIQDAVKALFTITATDPVTGAENKVNVSDSYITWSPAYAWPADGETKTFTVTVKVEAGTTYQKDASASVTVTLEDTTIRYTVKYMDGQGGELHSEVVSEFLATPTIADPTRVYYTFGGWTPAVAETVTADATYTAKWNPVVDGNGNGIADQEETYTVIYVLGNGEANVTHENLAYGAETPAAPELKWEGYNFKGWSPAVAANVSAPAEGNTITYTAQWTQKHAVIFMNNGTQYGEGVEVENEGLVAEPDAPVWDDDHDFLGWYLDEEKYDFTKPVTESLTLTAKWRTDFNRNDIEDSEEDHYTVIYNVYGVGTKHENILTGMPTPEMEDPTKTGYKFDGWDPEVAEKVTANVTYTAQWLNDANNNGVDDTLETITINVTAANEGDKITVTGAQLIEGTSDYIYDSTGTGEITIQAVPVTALDGLKRISTTYVHGIAVDEVPAALTYADNYSVTYSFTAADGQVVDVEFKAAGFVYNEERLLNFYPGMTGVVLDDVYNTIVDTPDLPGEYTLKYFARPASKHTVQLSSLGLPDTIMSVLKMIGQESITIDMPDLWLDVEVNDLSEEIENAVSLDQACAQYLTYDRIVGLWDIFQNNGGIVGGGVKAVTAELQIITDNIKNAAMYYGAHSFGYNASDAQTVTERIQVTYKNETRSIKGESTIDLKDLRAPAQILGSNVSVIYRDYTDEDLIALIAPQAADMDGNALTGAVVTCADITDPYTFEGKYVSDTAYELKFKFAGNETHKPAEAVYTVTVTKASASLDVPNQVVTYGDAYSMLAPEYFTLGNKYGDPAEVTASMIQFVIGLDVAQLDVDQDGVNGLNGKVQLILPEELQSMLDGILGLTGGDTSNGMEMSLSELTKYLEMIPDTSLDILNQALNAIASISEAGDVTITLGGDLPRNIGAYLYGTVSTCANYTTAYDVAYLVIKPDAARVYLDWNYDAENGIFTSTLLKEGNLSASAFNDEAFTELNQEATEMVQSVVFGININGDVVAELFAENADPEQIENLLDNGAYTQLAYVLDFGNTMNYAVPIARAFAITPDTVIVRFVDAAGENRDRHFVYDNQAHGMDVLVTTKDGEELLDTRKGQTSEALTVFYAGVQADGTTYTTQEAPVNSGIYTVSAFYKSVDANGKIDLVGADVGVMAIEPAASSVTVANKHTEFGTAADVVGMVTASSAVEGVTPQVTIITAGINTDGTFSENGLSAVQGVVNMDLPGWVDSYLKENKYLEAAYADGITKQVAIEYFNKASALLEETLGFDLFLGTVDLISQLPDSVTITFHDLPAAEPVAVGAYLVAAVVTDPNHYPSFHAGILTIRPANIEKAELSWVYEDSNNIFIKETLTYKLVDMSAEAKLDGEALDVNPTELFLGVDAENWTIKLCKDQTQLTAGVYTEFGFLVTADSNLSYYAEPIHREIVVLDGVYTVVFKDENGNVNHDRTFTYDGTPKAIGTAHVIPGQFAGENTTLTVVYTGMMANGDMYRSTEAPTNAGVYTAVAIFKEMDENGKIIGTGAGIGAMVIRKAELALDFVDTTVAYDAQEHMIDVTSNDGTADYLTVVIDKQANIVNIILEDDTTIIAQKLAELLKEELGVQNLTGEFDVTEVQQALHRIADTVLKIQIPEELKSVVDKFPEDKQDELNGLIADFEVYKANLDAVVKQIKDLMPVSGKVVFNGKLPVDAGTYQFYGLALSANYNPEATQGTLVIEPVEVTVIMDSFTVEAGDPMPVMTFTAVGVIGDDQLVVTPACTAEDTNTPGVYQITGQVQADPNYIFQPVIPGTLTVVKISLSSDSLELEVGDKDQITVSVLPEDQNYTVTYSSSDETVATVDEHGNVTALAEGKVTITVTVTLENGASFTKTLEVNVKPAMVPIKGFQPGQVVEILGKEFVADENGIVWLAQAEHDAVVSDTLIATSYDYGASSLADPNGVAEHQQYPTNMYVWYLNYNSQADEYTAEPISELTDFLTYKGTSIRWGTREKNGIRVITAVDEGDRAALIKGNLLSHQALSGFRLVEYGTLIRRADANGDFIYGAKSVQASRAYFNSEDRIFHRDNGDIWYTGAFVDLKDELCSMELLLRSYMILEKDGEQIVIHGGVLQRNIGYVALQNKDTYAPGQDAYDFIWNIIRNVYGDKVQG